MASAPRPADDTVRGPRSTGVASKSSTAPSLLNRRTRLQQAFAAAAASSPDQNVLHLRRPDKAAAAKTASTPLSGFDLHLANEKSTDDGPERTHTMKASEQLPSPDGAADDHDVPATTAAPSRWATSWLALALASGTFAAMNGVFAKLTTTTQTGTLAAALARILGLDTTSAHGARIVEGVVRAFFLLLNIASNAVMWVLFTRALTASPSTTQVAVLNTAANFFATALLGAAVFGEALGATWWAGAALLVAGSVIIGRRDGGAAGGKRKGGEGIVLTEGVEYRDEVQEEGSKRYRDEVGGEDEVEKERVRREKEGKDAWRR